MSHCLNFVGRAFVIGLFFMSIDLPASAAPAMITQLPKPGQEQSIRTPNFDYSNLGNDWVDGAVAGRALANMASNVEATLRGASDSGIYHRISPAVVIVITKDGLGSGSIISADGLILTCFHVVNGYSRVGIIFKPKNEGQAPNSDAVVMADVIKTDQVTDLALLKLEGPLQPFITPIVIGDFNKLTIGDDVHAIGHPTGQTWTYTKGYVSQIRKGYQWHTEDKVEHVADVIQTQTPINPGNSGGPLLNSEGKLIGVNSFIGNGEGLNFAIGSSEVQNFMLRRGSRWAQGASVAAAGCKPQVLFEGRDANNDASIKQIDAQCHGKVDYTYVEPDAQDQPIYVIVTTRESGKPDGIVYSYRRNGFWNISYWDSKGSGTWDTIGYHPDGKFKPSSYGPYVNN